MEDGRRRAKAAEHRGRGVQKKPYRCGETLDHLWRDFCLYLSLPAFLFIPPTPTPTLPCYHLYLNNLQYLSLLYLHHNGHRGCVSLYEKTAGNTLEQCRACLTLLLSQFCQLQTFYNLKVSNGFKSVVIISSVLNKRFNQIWFSFGTLPSRHHCSRVQPYLHNRLL